MPSPAVLTAALTGPVASKQDNPSLPTTPEEIAEHAYGAWQAGASVVHVHLRDASGEPTADVDIARRVIGLIEERCPVLVQLSTGVGFDVPLEVRSRLVEARPAMATLNVASMTFGTGQFINPPDQVRRLAARMRELGVKPEIEIYDTGHLELALALLEDDLLATPLQFSVVVGVRGGMPATAASIVALAQRIPGDAVWQVVGIGRASLPMGAIGLAMGANARTGMEDTLMLDRGRPAQDSAELIGRLAAIAAGLGRPLADVEQTRQLLTLAPPTAAPV